MVFVEVEEAPIVHGTVNVARLATDSVTIGDAELLSIVNSTADAATTDTLTNAATRTVIGTVSDTIAVSRTPVYFLAVAQSAARTPESGSSLMEFDYVSDEITWLGLEASGGPPSSWSQSNHAFTAPKSGVYVVTSSTYALHCGNPLSVRLRLAPAALTGDEAFVSHGRSTLIATNTIVMAAGDSLRCTARTARRRAAPCPSHSSDPYPSPKRPSSKRYGCGVTSV